MIFDPRETTSPDKLVGDSGRLVEHTDELPSSRSASLTKENKQDNSRVRFTEDDATRTQADKPCEALVENQNVKKFSPHRPCFTKRDKLLDSTDIPKGTEIFVVGQLSHQEYLVFSQEHQIHFVCKIDDICPYPSSDQSDNDVSSDSDHTSDYERDWPEIELKRGDEDENNAAVEAEKVQARAEKVTASTPKHPVIPDRKKPQIPVITKPDRRFLRRNSLALYNRRIMKAKSKLKTLQREISTIGELTEMDITKKAPETLINTPEPENPFLGCLKSTEKGHVDFDESEDEFDSENTTDSEADSNLMSTYVPPSTSHFIHRSSLTGSHRIDKETETALKNLRQNPNKVPQIKSYSLPLAFFLCRIIYQFAIRQGLHKVEFLDRWVFYAFPEVNQEKVHYYLGKIRIKFPKASLFQTLKELAKCLAPDDFMSLQTIQPRDKAEGLTDFLIRLQTDIPIIMNCTAQELPNLIMQFIKNSEQTSVIGTEFRRETMRLKGKPTLEKIHRIASRVDRLIKPCSEGQMSSFQNEKSSTVKHVCQLCNSEHENLRDDGTAWPSCEKCMFTSQSNFYNEHKFGTYNKPRRTNYYRDQQVRQGNKCRHCNNQTNWNYRQKRYFTTCLKCFQKSKSARGINRNNTQVRRSISNNFGRNPGFGTYAGAVRKDLNRPNRSINEFRTNRRYDPNCYRVAVRVQNLAKTAEITGLFDTGCNVDVISRKACEELRISHLIKSCNSTATVVDGAPVTITGRVRATVHIGKVPYTSEFSVIEHISQYDMMVGTKFMKSSGLLQDIFSATQNKLGVENVTRGN